MLPSLGKLRIPPAYASDTFSLAPDIEARFDSFFSSTSILLPRNWPARPRSPAAQTHSRTFDPPLAKCYKSTTSERRVPSLQGSCPGVEQCNDARCLWFQVSVPSTKWGFLVVWQAPPGATSNHQAYWCAGKRMPLGVTQLTSKISFVHME